MDVWDRLQNFTPSPLEELTTDRWSEAGIRIWIKRDDQLSWTPDDPFCGNKWRKLKYNLLAARQERKECLLSFGGAYSNHIAALASAGRHLGFRTVGIIRGEEVENPTLLRALQDGMKLHFMDRATYRLKDTPAVKLELEDRFGPHYLLPEGGTNALALKGCAELGKELLGQLEEEPHFIAVACGTGGTMAGLITSMHAHCQLFGVSALKGYFMEEEVEGILDRYTQDTYSGWLINEDYHHGGYAKTTPELLEYITEFEQELGIRLDPIYTGKLFYALDQLISHDYFPTGTRLVVIHTGGLQGWKGFV